MTIEIQRIEPHQIPAAKQVILSVARNVFQWQAPLEDILKQYDDRGELHDVDDLQSYCLDRQGLFLVAVDHGQVIGTGAIRHLDDDTADSNACGC